MSLPCRVTVTLCGLYWVSKEGAEPVADVSDWKVISQRLWAGGLRQCEAESAGAGSPSKGSVSAGAVAPRDGARHISQAARHRSGCEDVGRVLAKSSVGIGYSGWCVATPRLRGCAAGERAFFYCGKRGAGRRRLLQKSAARPVVLPPASPAVRVPWFSGPAGAVALVGRDRGRSQSLAAARLTISAPFGSESAPRAVRNFGSFG